jgi:hypothetical protein
MTEEKKTTGTVYLEGVHSSVEAFLYALEQTAEAHGKENLENSIRGASSALTVFEIANCVSDALRAAKNGDWDEFSGKMGEASTTAMSSATLGGYGMAVAIADMFAAVVMAQGGPDISYSTSLKEGLSIETTCIANWIFDRVYPDAIADVRINPNGPDNTQAPLSVGYTQIQNPLYAMTFEPMPITRTNDAQVSPDENGLTFEPEVIHKAHHKDAMKFDPQVVDHNDFMVLPPFIVTSVGSEGSQTQSIDDGNDDPLSGMDSPFLNDDIVFPEDIGPSLDNLEQVDFGGIFESSAPAFDLAPLHFGSVPELQGWCGTGNLDTVTESSSMFEFTGAPDLGATPDLGAMSDFAITPDFSGGFDGSVGFSSNVDDSGGGYSSSGNDGIY